MATRFDDELGDLAAPLLARGSSSSAGLAAATRAVVAGHGYGYGGARPGRRTSSSSARRRRRRLLRRSLLDSGLDSVAGCSTAAETEASDPPIGFRSEYESLRRASGRPEDDGDGDSEATDYDYGEGAAREEEEDVRPSLAPGVVARGAAIVLATGAGLAAYATSLVFAATVTGASTAAMTVLGVAAGACALTAPLVLRSEWRLAKMPSECARFRGTRVCCRSSSGDGPRSVLQLWKAWPGACPARGRTPRGALLHLVRADRHLTATFFPFLLFPSASTQPCEGG